MCFRIACVLALILVSLTPIMAQSPSFNCSIDNKPDEVLICENSTLSALDRRLSSLYFRLRSSLPEEARQGLVETQRRWLENRQNCERDFRCIKQLYESRIAILLLL